MKLSFRWRNANNDDWCPSCGQQLEKNHKCPKWKIVLRPGVEIDIPEAEYTNGSKKIA